MTGALAYRLSMSIADLAVLTSAVALLAFAAGSLWGAFVMRPHKGNQR